MKLKVSKILASIVALTMVAGAMAGCSADKAESTGATVSSADKSDDTAVDNKEEKKGEYRIALSNSYVGNHWRAEMVNIYDAYTAKLKEQGIIAESYSSSCGNDPQAQINEIRNMMSKGYDAIIVNAASPTALVPVLEEATDRGIVIVAFDNTVDSDKIYNVNTDQVEYGRKQAEWLCEAIGGKGNILRINGIEGTTVSRDRGIGFDETLAKYPDIKVLGQGDGKWDDAATSVTINGLLSAYKDQGIAGILSEGGGESAIYEALVQHGIDPKTVPYTGEMTNVFYKHMINDGIKGLGVGQPPYLSAASVDVALKVLNGEKVEPTTFIELPYASNEEAEKYYFPDQSDSFLVDWTNKDNTYGLTIEEIAPNK